MHGHVERAYLLDMCGQFCLGLIRDGGFTSSSLLVVDTREVGLSRCCVLESDFVREDVDAQGATVWFGALVVYIGRQLELCEESLDLFDLGVTGWEAVGLGCFSDEGDSVLKAGGSTKKRHSN